MTAEVFSIILGSGISLATSVVVTMLQNKQNFKLAEKNYTYDNRKWIREKKADVYILLASLLDDIAILINAETGLLDGKSFEENLDKLTSALDVHRGKIAIFVPSEINIELTKLRAELYALSSDVEKQKIDFSDIRNSEAMKTIIHAKTLLSKMAKDIEVQ